LPAVEVGPAKIRTAGRHRSLFIHRSDAMTVTGETGDRDRCGVEVALTPRRWLP
jgi:hypothetical protein